MKKIGLLFGVLLTLSVSLNAETVFLKGDFNTWSEANPMIETGNYFMCAFQFSGVTNWEQFKIAGTDWYGRSSAPVAVNSEKITLYSTDGSNVYQELVANKYYTFKTDTFVDNSGSGFKRDLVIFQTDSTPVDIASVSDDGATATTSLKISITLNADYSQDTLYVRYSTDSWSSSSVMKAVKTAEAAYEVSLTSLVENDVISYYVLTSSVPQSILEVDPSFYALHLNNNGGSNYAFTVPTATQLTAPTTPEFKVISHNNIVQLQLPSVEMQSASIAVINLAGQICDTHRTELVAGENVITLPSTFDKGIYLLQVNMATECMVKKIVVQ